MAFAEIATLTYTNGLIFTVHCLKHNDQYLFAYGGNDKKLYICNSKGELIKTIEGAHTNQI